MLHRLALNVLCSQVRPQTCDLPTLAFWIAGIIDMSSQSGVGVGWDAIIPGQDGNIGATSKTVHVGETQSWGQRYRQPAPEPSCALPGTPHLHSRFISKEDFLSELAVLLQIASNTDVYTLAQTYTLCVSSISRKTTQESHPPHPAGALGLMIPLSGTTTQEKPVENLYLYL